MQFALVLTNHIRFDRADRIVFVICGLRLETAETIFRHHGQREGRTVQLIYQIVMLILLIGVSQSTVYSQKLNDQNYDRLVPQGKEVDAIYGDYALRNQHVKAIIADPLPSRHANMTVRNVGGCLIDLACAEYESDQLSAFYPGRKQYPFSEVERNENKLTLIALGSEERPRCEVAYELDPDHPVVHVKTTFTNTTAVDWPVVLEDEIRLDGQSEVIRKSDSSKVLELFYINDVYWQQAYGFRAAGFRIRSSSDRRLSVLTYEPIEGELPLLKPGQQFEFTRSIMVHRDLVGVHAIAQKLSGNKPLRECSFHVTDKQGKPINDARIQLVADRELIGILRTNDQGQVTASLPDGKYRAEVFIAGHSELKDGAVQVASDGRFSLVCNDYSPGRVVASITDQKGNAIPAKVEFMGHDGTKTPNWGPDSAEFFVRNLAYTPNGKFEVELDSGTYNVIISHGPEFDAKFTRIEIVPNESVELQAILNHSVDSSGWISADFHSHSSPSGDNTSSQLGRVLNLAAEHIEFAPCTEHNRISTYDEEISSLNLANHLATDTGMELTGSPLPLNHQNVFPLKMVARTQDNGGPQTDADPEQQIERATLWDDRSEKLVQQNHPDIGWLFYDKNGDGSPDGGYSRSFRLMDAMEVHPIDPILRLSPYRIRDGKPNGNMPLFNWLQLLNQGHRIYGVVNTDAHYNYHGSGWLRNWIQSSTDAAGEIDSMEVVKASQEGRLIMSNGPFLTAEFMANGDQKVRVSGQDLRAPDGRVAVDVRVQCPNWFTIDCVFLLINGREKSDYSFNRDEHPQMFTDQVVQFSQTINVQLDEDSHIIVVAGNRSTKLGDVMGPSGGDQYPAALTNPVFVDIDGNGFKPNLDTLDHPLPVKFGARPNGR